jgi:hypothetical protein
MKSFEEHSFCPTFSSYPVQCSQRFHDDHNKIVDINDTHNRHTRLLTFAHKQQKYHACAPKHHRTIRHHKNHNERRDLCFAAHPRLLHLTIFPVEFDPAMVGVRSRSKSRPSRKSKSDSKKFEKAATRASTGDEVDSLVSMDSISVGGSPPMFRRYVDACHSLGLEPDTCLLSCLSTEYPHLSVSDAAMPGSWLPLLHALDLENHYGNVHLDTEELEAAHMARLDLQSLTIHYPVDTHSDESILHYDVDMRLLRDMLTLPACGIRKVKLTNLRISDAGLEELGACVESSTCLVSLDVSHANIGATCSYEAIEKFAQVLTHNVTLQHLDVSNNWLGYDTVQVFTNAVRQRPAKTNNGALLLLIVACGLWLVACGLFLVACSVLRVPCC